MDSREEASLTASLCSPSELRDSTTMHPSSDVCSAIALRRSRAASYSSMSMRQRADSLRTLSPSPSSFRKPRAFEGYPRLLRAMADCSLVSSSLRDEVSIFMRSSITESSPTDFSSDMHLMMVNGSSLDSAIDLIFSGTSESLPSEMSLRTAANSASVSMRQGCTTPN